MKETNIEQILSNHIKIKLSSWGMAYDVVNAMREACGQTKIELIKEFTKYINSCTKETEDLHPYKELGNRESHSKYNNGWSDACDILSQKIKNQIEKL